MNFEDTKEAFKSKSTKQLRLSYLLFWMMSKPLLVRYLSQITRFLLNVHFPIKWLIKRTIYSQFCGGEDKNEYLKVIKNLGKVGIGAILDYSVEGEDSEADFERTKEELIKIVKISSEDENIPCACMKITGIGSFEVLQKVQAGDLNKDVAEFVSIENRLDQICNTAFQLKTPIYIDAEESWIQGVIDDLCEKMILKYNKERAIVFTTLQMYRRDRLQYFSNLLEKVKAENVKVGVKIVRGAYLEKENLRAQKLNELSPINKSKEATDHLYNLSLQMAIENIEHVEICAGTHNENSCNLLVELMQKRQLENNDPKIWFSQLYGMSDHISFNLASRKYNVSKYLPYGPVKSTLPYLIRRAEENTAIAGQMGQEFRILKKELKRRKLAS
ncbi:MAG: proline dehydrogenase family protein [Flavobacteriales bacterium]|nr:proline dehydrogenase family protein [Flavobacteriales bacterium]